MQVHILSVGSELLRGEVLDTNSHWLCQQLLARGVFVQGRTTVRDKLEEVSAAVSRGLADRTDLILAVGGLGPTVDDLTRDGIAQAVGKPLVLDAEVLDQLRRRFASFGYEMPEQNRRQAEFPEGAEVLGNPWGSAPAFLVTHGASRLVALPGVPREMKKIFERILAPRLSDWFPDAAPPLRLALRTYGIGESLLEERLRDLIEKLPEGVSWSSLPRDRGNCDLLITASAPTPHLADACHEIHSQMRSRLDRQVYSIQPDEELDDVVHRLLTGSGSSLALAESCTGGLVAARLVAHSGSSLYLDRSLVTYSNRAKVEELGVLPATLEAHGAVSEEVALEMARGARERAGTQIGASVTGIAGPGGATAEKPVGLVYFAVVSPAGEQVHRRIFPGDREQVRSRSADAVLDALRLALLEA